MRLPVLSTTCATCSAHPEQSNFALTLLPFAFTATGVTLLHLSSRSALLVAGAACAITAATVGLKAAFTH